MGTALRPRLDRDIIDRAFERGRQLGADELCLTKEQVRKTLGLLELSADSEDRLSEIFQEIENTPDILTCRLVKGKITFVHRRLWPALVRLSDRLPVTHLAQVHQEHTGAGYHRNRIVDFPEWVPPGIAAEAERLDEKSALEALGDWALGESQ